MPPKIDIPADELRRLYCEEKLTTYDIAECFDCSQRTIVSHLESEGIETRRPGTQKIDIPADELRRLYCEEKLTLAEIGERFDCSQATVAARMEEHGIRERPTQKRYDIDTDELRRLYWNEELTIQEIAEQVGCSAVSIFKRMRRNGIPRRRRGGRNEIELDAETLKRLYWGASLSTRELAEYFDCSYQTINRRLKEADIPLRQRGKSTKRTPPEGIGDLELTPEEKRLVETLRSRSDEDSDA